MVNVEHIKVLVELLLLYVEGERNISPALEIILEKTKDVAKIFEEIEMSF